MTAHSNGHPFNRNGLIHQAANKRRNSNDIPDYASQYIPVLGPGPLGSNHVRAESLWEEYVRVGTVQVKAAAKVLVRRLRTLRPKDALDVRLALILLWFLVLWWGEKSIFMGSVGGCTWDRWEDWVRIIRFI